MPGTVGPGGARSPESIDAGYWFLGDAGATGPASGGAAVEDVGSAGDLAGRAGAAGLRGVLPRLRRSCSGRRLYSSHCCFSPCFVRRELYQLLVALARGLAFLGGELGPGLHAPL